jgi:LPS export ABC transporter permease LptF
MPISLRIKRVDRYLLQEVLQAFWGSLVFFCFILLMLQALRLSEYLIVHSASLKDVVHISGFMILSILPIALPVGFFIGVLMAFSRLSLDSEIIALKASGISLLRMSAPVAFLALFVSAVSIVLSAYFVPLGEARFKAEVLRLGAKRFMGELKEGTFNPGFFDLLVFADRVDRQAQRMERVFIYDEREPKNPMTIIAKSGEVVTVRSDRDEDASILLKLHEGSIHHPSLESQTYQKIDFKTYHLFLEVIADVHAPQIKPQMLSRAQLQEKLQTAAVGSSEYLKFLSEYWRRIGAALQPLLFVWVGMGLGTFRTRMTRAGAGMLAGLLLTVLWVLQTYFTVLAHNGTLPVAFAALMPDFFLLILGVYSFRKASW